jgi:AraC-like DNA-binding protein
VEALRIVYEVSELEDSLTISHANEQLAQEEIRNKRMQLYSVSGVLVLLLLFGAVITLQLRRQARSNAHLLKMNLEKVAIVADKNPAEKYASSSLSDDKKDQILADLKTLMEEQQLFKDPQLKLETVAEQLDVSRTYLSQIINQTFSENFSSYINALRVRLAKEYLIQDEYQIYSIQGIAEMVGFNSLSAFNAAFKKETGLTPSYFRKNSRPSTH